MKRLVYWLESNWFDDDLAYLFSIVFFILGTIGLYVSTYANLAPTGCIFFLMMLLSATSLWKVGR